MERPWSWTAGDAFAQGAAVYGSIREEEARFREAFLSLGDNREARRDKATQACSARRSPVHAQYPLLIGTAFPFMEQQKLLELCRFGRLYAEHLLALDRALDRGEQANPLELLVSSLQQTESLLGLYRWFPPGHLFWEDFWERASRTWRAVLLERSRHGHRIEAYPWEEYEAVARDKASLLGIFALAPTYLSDDRDLRRRLSNSLDEHHKGLVLLDDLQDWREDYIRGHYSYLLTRVLLENGLDELVRNGARPALATVGRLLYEAGVAEEQLFLAEACFRKTEEGLEERTLPDWIAMNRRYGALCVALRERVGHFRIRRGRKISGGARVCPEGVDRERPPGREERPTLLVHDGIPETSVNAALQGIEGWRPLVRESDAFCIALGRWEGMPAHFHLVEGGRIWVGIQACGSEGGAQSTSRRPVETETALACVRAQRILCLGRERTLLEMCFVAGLALCACLDLRSRQDPWRHLAMGALEWQWCQKNEWVLWEMLEKHGRGLGGVWSATEGRWDPFPDFGAPAPRGAVLYLSLRIFELASVNAVVTHPRWLLERWNAREIRSALGLSGE